MSPRVPVLLTVLCVSLPGLADETVPIDNAALATDLFEAGVKKMEDGHCEETPIGDRAACTAARENFRRAYELYPAGLGALRNLAFVEKGLGLLASSARHFRELARKAPLDPKPARRLWADFAKKELEGLEPRVPHLTVKLQDPPAGAVVLIDGADLPKAAWNMSLDLDPGSHEIRADASGRKPFLATITLAEGETKSILVVLVTEGTAAPEPAAPTMPVPPSKSDAPEWWRTRTAPLILTGVGAATVAVGLGLGWAAIAKHKDVCPGAGCDPNAYAEGKSLARASTIVTGVGLVAAASGIAWYVLGAPSNPEKRTAVVPSAWAGGAGLQVVGHF
ncbi:MAG: PEGA domain-containing protein [Polyangiales bacterium]